MAWSKGQINDAEYVTAMQKLIDEGKILPFDSNQDEYNPDQPIPIWVKNNVRWWIEGGVGDDGYRDSIIYLYKNGVLRNPLN